MEAGKLDRWIQLQELTVPVTQDSTGAPQEVWTDLCEVPAAFERPGGREFPIAQKIHAESTARFRIRYQDLKPDIHRVLYSQECDASPIPIWNILAVNHIGRREETHLEVSEIR